MLLAFDYGFYCRPFQMARNKIEIPDDVRKEDKENLGGEGAGDVPDKVGVAFNLTF